MARERDVPALRTGRGATKAPGVNAWASYAADAYVSQPCFT
jgi:hypothetical protein